jgi:hypothetical protein
VKIDWSFLKIVAASYGIAALLTYYPISEFSTEPIVQSIVGGMAMSLLNLLAGYLAIEGSFERSHTTFLKIVLGGMVARLLAMWLALIVLLKWYGYHAASLMLTLLFFYVVNLVLEFYFLQKKVSLKSQTIS